MKDEDLLRQAQDRFDRAQRAERKQREDGEEDLRFLAGNQWPEQIENERIRESRPCLTFNRLPQFVQQVIGDARQNKPAIKVHPVDEASDEEIAEIYEGLIRNIESQSRAPQAYITALEHSTGCGFGAWRVITEYSTDDGFEQDIRIKRITDPFSVTWDESAKEYDKSDAMYCFVSEWISEEVFKERWPSKTPSNWEEEYRTLSTRESWMVDGQVRICEYWVKKPVEKTLAYTHKGETIDITGTKLDPAGFKKVRKVKTHKVCRYLLTGHDILEGEKEFPCRYIPIVPVFGPEEWHDGVLRPRSLVKYAKDPMRMYNFWQSTIAEKIALAPKSPWLVTPTMVEGLEKYWNESNKKNRPYLPYNPDPEAAANRPVREEPAYVNSAEIQQSMQAIEDLKATLGMYDASIGAQGNETSGRAIVARQREGDTASFSWIDNLARSIQHTGRILIDMIPRIYDTERVIRVMGADDSVELVKINQWVGDGFAYDLSQGKYDVEITVGPSYATKRLEAADSMLAFIQAYPNAAPMVGDLIAKNMDWPGADDIADRLKKMLPPGVAESEDDDPQQVIGQMNQQIQQLMMQIEEMGAELQKHDDAQTQERMASARLKDAQTFKTEAEGVGQLIENRSPREAE